MLVVKQLKDDQFSRLGKIFSEEFGSSLPLPENSEIIAAYENARLVGFVLVENVKLIGQIYVAPAKRDSGTLIVNTLIGEVKTRFDGKETVGAVASESRFERLFEAFGMYKISGIFFRKNIDDND